MVNVANANPISSGAFVMRHKIEAVVNCLRELEEGLSVHDSIMDAASAGMYEMSELCEAICYARDALARVGRISEVMECIGGEVTRLRWEICKLKKNRSMA